MWKILIKGVSWLTYVIKNKEDAWLTDNRAENSKKIKSWSYQ